jgi:predicted CoA-binding protein
MNASERQRILRDTRTVAIVGASANPSRASYFVYTYLKSTTDYELYLVNPSINEIDGAPVYPSLAALPVIPDLVDVFRKHDDLPQCWPRCWHCRSCPKRCGCNWVCAMTKWPATPRPPAWKW